jgi:hypothetical protein
MPIGDAFALGAEGRWQHGEGDTGGINEGFLGDKINLGGWTANATIHFASDFVRSENEFMGS